MLSVVDRELNVSSPEHGCASATSDSEREVIDAARLDELLCIYPPSQRHLRNFRYIDGHLWAELLPHHATYCLIKLNYFSACQIIMAVSQMGYVLCGTSIADPEFQGLPCRLYSEFLSRLKAGEIFYTRTELDFRRKTANCRPHDVSMRVRRAKVRSSLLLVDFDFDLAYGSTIGRIRTAMPIATVQP